MIRFFRITVFTLTVLLTSQQFYAQSATELATMKTRLINSVYFPLGYNLANCNPDGTFANVAYPASYPTDFTGEPRSHLSEMYGIALAYNTQGDQYKSQDLLNAYVKAWNWWYTTNPIDNNWWYRSIGYPNSLYPSFLLMADELKVNQPEAFNTLKSYLLAEWTPTFYAEVMSSPDGANTSDVAYYTFASAIVAGVDSIAAQTSEVLTNLIAIQTTVKGEGIHPDYSFSAHTGTARQLYLGNYGKEYLGGIIRFMVISDDTSLEVPADRVTIFENLFLEGVSWIAYRNMFDHHQHGRRVIPTDGYPKSLSVLGSLIQLNTPQKAKLQEMYNWMARTDENNAINVQQGNKMFWRHDYMVHKGKNYFTTNRMSSTRVLCSESANGEGLNNYYTGSAINYIYITGQEYLEFWNDMNWRRLPGLTAPQKPLTTTLPTVPPTSARGLNGDAFAGGTSDGKTGVTGFKYNKVHSTEVNVTANKSVFYYDDYFVVLGSDVKAGKTYGVPFTTTVNQVKFKDNFIVDNDGTIQNMTLDQTLAPATSNWAYLNSIGYQFLTNTKLNFEVKTVGSTPVAWMAFNHGNQPVSDKYAYAVYPNITQDEFTGKMNHQRFEVVSNTSLTQCVVDTVSKIAQVVFFTAGKIDLPGNMGFVQTNQPIVLQLRWQNDSVYINAANPYCESRNIFSLTLTLGGLYAGDNATLDAANNQTVITTSMPVNEFQGSTQSISLKKSDFSGIINPKAEKARLSIFPNRLKAGTPCSFISNEGQKQVTVSIYRTDGTLVQKQILSPDGENRINIDTKGLGSNIYIVKSNSMAGKLIVE